MPYLSKTRKPPTEEEYAAYRIKMLTPFFAKHGVTVIDNDFDAAFIVLQRLKPELFETDHPHRR